MKAAITDLEHHERAMCRKHLFNNLSMLDEFIEHNYYNLPLRDIDLIRSWRSGIRGNFMAIEHQKEGTVLYDHGKYYCVKGLTTPLPEMIGPRLPTIIETILLPYQDVFITDGLIVPTFTYYSQATTNTIIQEYKNAQNKNKINSLIDCRIEVTC